MIKLIRKLLGLCNHEFTTIRRVKLCVDENPVGYDFYQICKKCGEPRRRRIVCDSYKEFKEVI